MFKTDPHVHTSDISLCASLRSDLMAEAYHKAGYKTIFITEHFAKLYCSFLGDLPWEDKVTIFLSSYQRAKVKGEQLGINVIMGAEVSFQDKPGDYLVYGITKEFLLGCPDVYKMGIEAFSKYAHDNGVFIVQAHPYRDGVYYPTPEYVDGMEVYNTNPRHENFTQKTLNCAREHNMYITAGSDSHHIGDVGTSAILTDFEIKTAEDYINAIKSGNYKIEVHGEIVE
ncbi:MAG: PHP domain-containing protein [Ruminococcaceae bacterium]|nr:PHP domain-containing protein [Oscillospiraceae bacterium]